MIKAPQPWLKHRVHDYRSREESQRQQQDTEIRSQYGSSEREEIGRYGNPQSRVDDLFMHTKIPRRQLVMEQEEIIKQEVGGQQRGGKKKPERFSRPGIAKGHRCESTYRCSRTPQENPEVRKHTRERVKIRSGGNVPGHDIHIHLKKHACRRHCRKNGEGWNEGNQ